MFHVSCGLILLVFHSALLYGNCIIDLKMQQTFKQPRRKFYSCWKLYILYWNLTYNLAHKFLCFPLINSLSLKSWLLNNVCNKINVWGKWLAVRLHKKDYYDIFFRERGSIEKNKRYELNWNFPKQVLIKAR